MNLLKQLHGNEENKAGSNGLIFVTDYDSIGVMEFFYSWNISFAVHQLKWTILEN
jgi:hypothetical protein